MNITTTLTGTEISLNGVEGRYAAIRNDSTDIMYAACESGIAAGADGVLSIPAGQSAVLSDVSGLICLMGTGSAMIVTSDYSTNPFKTSAQSGGSGADEVARAAITAHAGNADIHVTAAQKSAWDAKAELSDIPDKLPADGGNAASVGGYPVGTNGKKGVLILPEDNGTLEIGQRIDFHSAGSQDYAVRLYVSPPNWDSASSMPSIRIATPDGTTANIADGGNAASVGVYTEAKIAALEARIAALEVK